MRLDVMYVRKWEYRRQRETEHGQQSVDEGIRRSEDVLRAPRVFLPRAETGFSRRIYL